MKSDENICLNCDNSLQDELYCPICGQKASIRNLSLKYFFSSFMVAFLDFDKKILRSLKDIWVPNKVSNDFLKGGRKTYVNHLRFFFICLAVTFGLIALNMRQLDLGLDVERKVMLNKILADVEAFEKESHIGYDSIYIDTLKRKIFAELVDYQDTIIKSDNEIVNFSVSSSTGNIDIADIYELKPDSIISKYNIEGNVNKFLTKQGLKVVKNGSSAIKFWISNMLWGIILVTVLMALLLKVLFIRHKSFYVEHLMHMINFHCVLLISLSVLLFIDLFVKMNYFLLFIPVLVSFIYLIVSLKRYYSQSFLKIAAKSTAIGMGYLFFLSLTITLILGVSTIFF